MTGQYTATGGGTGTPTGTPAPDSVVTRSDPDVYTSTPDPIRPATLPVTGSADSGSTTGHATASDDRSGGRSVAASVAEGWPRHWPRPEYPDPATITATRAWLRREIDAGARAATGEIPQLGTAAWTALPDGEPAKWAAVFHAARAWFNEYVSIPETTARALAEERERWEAIIAEQKHADYARFRAYCLETADGMERRERRERDAARTMLPNRTGPELIAAARASWAWLDGPDPDGATAGSPPNSAESAEVA